MADRDRPCPAYIIVGKEKRYCEQGPKGHPGTCIGNKPEYQYKRELEIARVSHEDS